MPWTTSWSTASSLPIETTSRLFAPKVTLLVCAALPIVNAPKMCAPVAVSIVPGAMTALLPDVPEAVTLAFV